eukprot:m.170185 g.170185  ORF g.170185 m.170185 type:complete len:366 (+) comp13208_c0_seq1:41-1138(+)
MSFVSLCNQATRAGRWLTPAANLAITSRNKSAISPFQAAPPSDGSTNILVTGALGQLGMELVHCLRLRYGADNVLATDIRKLPDFTGSHYTPGPYRYADVLDYDRLQKICVEHSIDKVVHLSALLSAIGEREVSKALQVNNIGTQNILELARYHNLSVFCPSTIGAFGPTTPSKNTPDLTIMRPTTIYGVTKVYMEMLGEYYHNRYGVDFRSIRLPGIISTDSEPGGGTTDYAVEIFHHAVEHPGKAYSCYLRSDTGLPMMMLDDCVRGIADLIEADDSKLTQRVYNMSAASFTPAEITAEIAKHVVGFRTEYNVDPVRQAIADSWPDSFDDSNARRDWGWHHEFGLEEIVKYSLESLAARKGKK